MRSGWGRGAAARRCGLYCAMAAALCGSGFARAQDDSVSALFDLSLEELSDLIVVTASRSAERVRDAPATVIVLTRDELIRRGYRELSEIYNDLPGMDLSRPYGDTYFRNQWRGLRKSIGTPYLLLLDGAVLNHLYFNQEEVIATLPMSSIEQVEVVYGPASAVYGANAFVGVINVITRASRAQDGTSFSGRVTAGSFDTRITDLHYLHRRGEWQLSLATRFDDGDIDRSRASSYEWTREHYLQDRRLWGAFVDDPTRAGVYSSPHENRALDLRVRYGATEFALQYFALNTRFGTVYPGDRVQMLSYWSEPDFAAHIRHNHKFGERLTGTLLLRYRQSGVDNLSDTLEAYEATDPITGAVQRVVNYSFWAAETSSLAVHEDLEFKLDERWSLLGGFKHERKDLQKAYRILFGPDLPPAAIGQIGDYPNPPRPTEDIIPRNRIDTRESAGYAMARLRLTDVWGWGETHNLLAGVRFDHHSEYGTARTLRGGYVLSRGPWTAKLLYGEGFNEPAPRELYGGWRGSGSNPTLDPETARTLEASLGYQSDSYSLLLSAYRLDSENNIITFSGGARNLGDRAIRGVDLHLNARLPIGATPWSLWGYYSYIEAEESRPTASGVLQTGPVGDTAPHKLHVGVTWPVDNHFSATLRGRYIDVRRTVPTNPIGRVPSYTTFDLNLLYRDWPTQGIGWSLAVLNLADRSYFHPGLREANAGTRPGFFDESGRWNGSGGYYNSLLPQDGRGLFFSVTVDF